MGADQPVIDNRECAISLDAMLNNTEIGEESALISENLENVSSSTLTSNEVASDSKVHLVQKPKKVDIDSDEEFFCGESISSPSKTSQESILAWTNMSPLAPKIPKACVVSYVV